MEYVLNKRADTHPDFCEDAFFYTERDGWVIAAVFDGCSSGINSHSASQLHSYLMRATLECSWVGWYQLMNVAEYDPKKVINRLCAEMWYGLQETIQTVMLEELEVLSTIVVAMYHVRRKYLVVKFIGDGAVSINGTIQRMESIDNAPRYLSYLTKEEATHEAIGYSYPGFVYTNVDRWSIMTDGIDAMKHPHKSLEECINYLLEDNSLRPSEAMLKRKMNILHKEGMVLNDDLTIIRYESATT